MKFTVTITEVVAYTTEVDAVSPEDAREIALQTFVADGEDTFDFVGVLDRDATASPT